MTNINTVILTIQKVKNYGASLQTFALHKTLINKGVPNKIVDFVREDKKKVRVKKKFGFTGFFIYLFVLNLKQFRRYLLNVISFRDFSLEKLRSKDKLFEVFEEKHLSFTDEIQENELEKLNKSYKNFISGSDQVWNHTFNFSVEAYFLGFVENKNNRIAFAPSFGITEIPKKLLEKYRDSFSKFNHLTVREQEGASIVKDITGMEIPVVLDPIFLMDKANWIKELKLKLNKPKKPYILFYTLGAEDKKGFEICEKIQKQKGYDIVRLGRGRNDLSINKGVFVKWDVGPIEFLELILNSSLVVTNSFHGTAFSINFGIPFFCILSKTNNRTSRLRNILRITRLENRVLYEYEDRILKNLTIANTDEVMEEITKEREKALLFLDRAIE